MDTDSAMIEQLISDVAQGAAGAFARLHHLTEARVRSAVMRIIIDPWQSEEVTQEVFLEIWQKANRFDPRRGTANAWIITIARRRAIDRVRAAQASRERDHRDSVRSIRRPHDEVWETVQARVARDTLLEGLKRITPLQRAALTSTYLDGRTIAQAAQHLGASESAVKARVSEGIASLRRVIASTGEAA